MAGISRRAVNSWIGLGARFLPFADAATPDMPLSRLLRLSLFQVSVGMALVLLVGTLNRVMIVELDVPASLVGAMIALPLIFAPFRALIGFRSDNHSSALGWRRVPFMYRGAMVQFGGLAIMPFALLVLAHKGDAVHAPEWLGLAGAGAAFLLVGAGLHTIQTVGLALATDRSQPETQPKVVGLMYVAMLAGMMVSALLFGRFLSDFSAGRLVQVIQASAVATILFNGVALWKQEPRGRRAVAPAARPRSFKQTWAEFCSDRRTVIRLLAIGLGTMGFSMEDVLLEPYGGQVLGLAVGDTTKLTAALAIGGLCGFALASAVLSKGADAFRLAATGALLGVPAFAAVIASGPSHSTLLFGTGTALIGFSAGLFGHGTLTATMRHAPANQSGLALGAWGAVQASMAGLAIAGGGALRDIAAIWAPATFYHGAVAYDVVYLLEIVLLLATLGLMTPLARRNTVAA